MLGSPSASSHVIVRSLLLSPVARPVAHVRARGQRVQAGLHEFAAIAISPCVFVLKRALNARSADAVPGSTRQTASTATQMTLRTTDSDPQPGGRRGHPDDVFDRAASLPSGRWNLPVNVKHPRMKLPHPKRVIAPETTDRQQPLRHASEQRTTTQSAEGCSGRVAALRARADGGWPSTGGGASVTLASSPPRRKGSSSYGPLDRLRDRPPRADPRVLGRPVAARRLRGGEPRRAAVEPLQRAGLRVRERPEPAQGPHGRPFRRLVHAGGAAGSTAPPTAGPWQAAAQRAAKAVEGGKAGPLLDAGKGVVYAQVATPLENQDAAKATPRCAGRSARCRAPRRTCPAIRPSATTPRRSSTRTSGAASRSRCRSRCS